LQGRFTKEETVVLTKTRTVYKRCAEAEDLLCQGVLLQETVKRLHSIRGPKTDIGKWF